MNPFDSIRWLECANKYAGDVPGWSLVQITGLTDGILEINRPSADGQDVLIVSPAGMGQDGRGAASIDLPNYALFEEGDGTPVVGELWGPGDGSFKLRKGKAGFCISGGILGAGTAYARVQVSRALPDQMVDIVSATPDHVTGYYDAYICIRDSFGNWVRTNQVWVDDPNK